MSLLLRGALCLSLALPLSALAFESVESDSINPPEAGASGNIRAAIDGRSGNTKRSDYTVSGRTDYRSRDTDMFVLVEHSRAKDRTSNEIEDNTWVHAHYRDEFKRGLAAEAFVDGLQDDFRLLDSRVQLGLGARFTLDYEPDNRAVYAGVGLLHEWTDQNNMTDHYWRANTYFAYKRQLNEQVRGLFNISYQPNLEKAKDYLVNAELAAIVKLATHLDLKIGVQHQYDGDVPRSPLTGPLIKSYDTKYVTALTLKF